MFDNKKLIYFAKVNFLLVIIILVIIFFPKTYSKFESDINGEYNSNIAFYLFNTDYKTNKIKLAELLPGVNYSYNFTVSNYKDNVRSEVDLEYVLTLRMTTNIPLTYELYLNGSSRNLINDTNFVEVVDDDGTIFKEIVLDSVLFDYNENKLNSYILKVNYPSSVDSFEYQGFIDSVKITVDSKQVI